MKMVFEYNTQYLVIYYWNKDSYRITNFGPQNEPKNQEIPIQYVGEVETKYQTPCRIIEEWTRDIP